MDLEVDGWEMALENLRCWASDRDCQSSLVVVVPERGPLHKEVFLVPVKATFSKILMANEILLIRQLTSDV
jgi:hypothetical protein